MATKIPLSWRTRLFPEAVEHFDDLYPAYANRPTAAALFIKPDDVPV